MRDITRIQRFKELENKFWKELFDKYVSEHFKLFHNNDGELNIYQGFMLYKETFFKYWQKYPDLRLGQAIINLFGLLPKDEKNSFYNIECDEIRKELSKYFK